MKGEMLARETFIEETMEPIADVGGPVVNANQEIRLGHREHGLPDPIRQADFDPQRTRSRVVYTLNPNMMHPLIEGDFYAGKQQMGVGVGIPRGTHAGAWDWDAPHWNIRRPTTTSYGNEVDDVGESQDDPRP